MAPRKRSTRGNKGGGGNWRPVNQEMQSHGERYQSSGQSGSGNDQEVHASSQARWVPRAQGSTSTGRVQNTDSAENEEPEAFKQNATAPRKLLAQAQVRATFYPKFENEKSDQEVRTKMIEVVEAGKGVLEVSLKHSGSLFMYSGDHGGAFAKNSYGNLYTAVGVFVLGRTFEEAWGAQASQKQMEFNDFLETSHLCISMELVTAVLGDHGQRPKQDYVVVTAIADLVGKPRFFATPDLIAFCRQWRLPTNHVWLFSSRKSAVSFFTAYDALCEEGTASAVSRILDEVSDISVPASKSHTEVQGEILEGLVARIVTFESAERLKSVLRDFPLIDCRENHGKSQLGPSLREICGQHTASEKKQINALLQSDGQNMCSDLSDWMSVKESSSSFLEKYLKATPMDYMTMKLQEMLRFLKERKLQVRYPCHLKSFDSKQQKTHYKMTVHVLKDFVFRKYQDEMRRNPELWPLYRGFFLDVYVMHGRQESDSMALLSGRLHDVHIDQSQPVKLADDTENLMLKLKFLPYKIRTFLIRNGLPILSQNGISAYRRYYLRQMENWHTSADKQEQLDYLLKEWAQYITGSHIGKGFNGHSYLSEAEPFLERFAQRSLRNKNLVGFSETDLKMKEFINSLAEDGNVNAQEVSTSSAKEASEDLESKEVSTSGQEALEDLRGKEEPRAGKERLEDLKNKGLIVFFPGIPGCGKSAVCKELLNESSSFADGRSMHSLMGDLVKGRYWPQLAQERKRRATTTITLADKNAPNVEVWKIVEDMCSTTSAVGIPVVPDSDGAELNPFSLEVLSLFMYRVLQRSDHPGNLDKKSPNAGYVLLMFYDLYAGKDRTEFEETLKGRFGYLVKLPVLKASRPAIPSTVLEVLTSGLDLFKRHTQKHGRMDSTKGSFQQEWSHWEKQVRNVLDNNAAFFQDAQVPFEEMVQSVKQQLLGIVRGEICKEAPMEEQRAFKSVTFAAVSLDGNLITDILWKLAASNTEVQKYLKRRHVVVKSAHLTLAHKYAHGVAAVAELGDICGVSVEVKITAFLYSNKLCALEAQIAENDRNVSSRNEWPHITVWTGQGIKAKEANSLPQLVCQGHASRVDFEPVNILGVVRLF